MLKRSSALVITCFVTLVLMAFPSSAAAQTDLLGSLLRLLSPPAPVAAPPAPPAVTPVELAAVAPAVPETSGTGRRIVYSLSQQRVWLIEADETVAKSHLVTGNPNFPKPGNYSVFSRSRYSRSGAVRLEYMVRFTRSSRLAVGFHSIPVRADGSPIQTEAQLGQAIGRGCVRQTLADAAFLWDWAPDGTAVVVTG